MSTVDPAAWSTPARSATSTTPATASCSWWPRTGSVPSTWSSAEPIPDKGRVLTAMTAFWCEELADLAPSTLVTADPDEIAAACRAPGLDAGGRRASPAGPLLVRRAEMLPIECIVRGYLAGQA